MKKKSEIQKINNLKLTTTSMQQMMKKYQTKTNEEKR